MNKTAALLLIISSIVLICCRKKPHQQPSHEKEIKSFDIIVSDSEYAEGIIRNDSIFIQISHNARKDSLEAVVKFTGERIRPFPANIVDYTKPVIFTVTAEDSSTRQYIVLVSNFTSAKEISSFIFKASDNEGLGKDIKAKIENNTISAVLPADADITKLKPSISFTGESISPSNGASADFSNGTTYTVTADDGSKVDYNVFVTSNNLVYIGSGNGKVYALSCADGKVKWTYNTGNPLSHPIYRDGIVYIGSSDGTFYALDGTTGLLRWKFFDQKINYSAPHVINGVVYVGYSSDDNYKAGTYAINSQTGNLIWKEPIQFGVGPSNISGPTYADGMLYISLWNAGLYALDAATGEIKWRYYPGITTSNPAVVNGTVYICAERGLLAFDSKTGALKWTALASISTQCAPAVFNGVVYACGTNFYAINADDGSLKWKTHVTDAEGQITTGSFSSPVISAGLLFVGNGDCNTFAFDPETGAVKWSYNNNGGEPKSWLPGPVVAHGMLITDRGDNMLKAFYASTGRLIWTFTADGPINTYPCIVDTKGNAFYCGASGNVN